MYNHDRKYSLSFDFSPIGDKRARGSLIIRTGEAHNDDDDSFGANPERLKHEIGLTPSINDEIRAKTTIMASLLATRSVGARLNNGGLSHMGREQREDN